MGAEGRGAGPVVYIDRSVVHEDRLDDLKAGIRALVAFVDTQQPQMVAYGFYLDEDARQMTVLSVHPDSASLERHGSEQGTGLHGRRRADMASTEPWDRCRASSSVNPARSLRAKFTGGGPVQVFTPWATMSRDDRRSAID